MPLPYLEIQNDSNSFFSAVVFATLFPVLQDDDLFETRFVALFGQSKASKMMSFNKALLAYSTENTPFPELSLLIKDQLRPRLVTHLSENRAAFSTFIESDDAWDAAVEAIKTEAPIHTQVVASVLSTWLACTLRVCDNPAQTNFKDYNPSTDATVTISVLQAGSHFHSLIDVHTLSPEVLQNLLPCLKKAVEPRPKEDVRDELIATLHNEHFNRLLQTTFTALPKCMEGILNVPTRPSEFIDPLRTPYLTQTEGRVLRLDALKEAKNAQALLSSDRVRLLPSQRIGYWDDWSISLTKSAVASALVSTARFDLSAIVTMISMGTIEFGPLAMASLPFFLISFSLNISTSVMGKHYAIQYEEAIRTAKLQIDAGNYVDSIKVLDAEFSRWFGARSTRI